MSLKKRNELFFYSNFIDLNLIIMKQMQKHLKISSTDTQSLGA